MGCITVRTHNWMVLGGGGTSTAPRPHLDMLRQSASGAIVLGVVPVAGVDAVKVSTKENLLSVDVFIVAFGQPDRTTFDCAVRLDGLHSASVSRHDLRCPHFTHHRRQLLPTLGVDWRAGSVNFVATVKEASVFGIKAPGEGMAISEAYICLPQANFLRAAIAAVLSNAKVGLVKTGHGFINLPLLLSQVTSTLIETYRTSSDSRSGFVLRRSVFTVIGGLPFDSWIADGHVQPLRQQRVRVGRGLAIDELLILPTNLAFLNALFQS
ncbi:hypothetical protein RQP46_011461 [Phenoliferia psychrophenolica]